ncbi:MAG: hypothetical protein BV458_07300 [Thermoplasmata archaeon M9B2D]|nr:MAG: hypothetical protein BV458_07300 [Thermoplasmata archaeon M9B2D]
MQLGGRFGHIVEGNPSGIDPLSIHNPPFEIVVDLVSGTLKPDIEGDSVENYYTTMSKWFHEVLVED